MEINKNDFISDYVIEAQENLDGIDNAAISLINIPRDYETLKELLRLLHTLKGSSRMMEFSQIEQIINNLETVFKNFQTNRMEVASSYCYLLLNVNEFIRKAIHKIEKQSENQLSEDENVDSTVENFDEIMQNINSAAEGKTFSYEFSTQKNQNENSEINADKNADGCETTKSACFENETNETNKAIEINKTKDTKIINEIKTFGQTDSTEKKGEKEAKNVAEKQIFAESSSPVMISDTKTIKIQISQMNSILQNYDKLLMRQIKLKKELSEL